MIRFFVIAVAAYAWAIAAVPLLRLPTAAGRILAAGAALALVAFPLFIDANQVVLRGIAEFLCVDLGFKMVDYARQWQARGRDVPGIGAYLRFLIPFPVLLVVFGRRERRLIAAPPVVRELAIVVATGAIVVGVFGAIDMAAKIPAVRYSFPLDHAIKVILFTITIVALSRCLSGLERLCRFNIRPIVDRAYLATTPGEFWRLYNNRVGEWLYLNVFRPSGGQRAPIRGVFLAFFVSAALHELAFAVATSRFTGCQFAFFMLQAPAVTISLWLQPKIDRAGPAARTIARLLTIIWFYTTSVLFFEGVNRIFPFVYASHAWLP